MGFRLRIRFWRRRRELELPPAQPAGPSPTATTDDAPAAHSSVRVSPGILGGETPVVVEEPAGESRTDRPDTAPPPPVIPPERVEETSAGPESRETRGGSMPPVILMEPATAPLPFEEEPEEEAAAVPIEPAEEVEEEDTAAGVEAVEIGPYARAVDGIPGVEEDEEDEDAFIGSGLPIDENKTVEVACPNCGETLESKPISRTVCVHCERIIHLRARQTIFHSGLVGEDDVDAIDFLERIEPFAIDEKQCQDRMHDRSLAEAIWQLCEERLEQLPIPRQANLLKEMGEYLRWQGKDATPLRRRAEGTNLLAMKEKGVLRVKIVARSNSACRACQEVAGSTLEIERALHELPLPVQSCTGPTACRCVYSAEADEL